MKINTHKEQHSNDIETLIHCDMINYTNCLLIADEREIFML